MPTCWHPHLDHEGGPIKTRPDTDNSIPFDAAAILRLPLPKHAPKRLDSALVHATSLSLKTAKIRASHLTDAQALSRILVACHEAAHYVIAAMYALKYETGPDRVYVGIPGRHHPYFRGLGAAGAMTGTPTDTTVVSAEISMAGAAFEALIGNPHDAGNAKADWEAAKVVLEDLAARGSVDVFGFAVPTPDECLAYMKHLVLCCWPVIDFTATAFLTHGNSTGVLSALVTSNADGRGLTRAVLANLNASNDIVIRPMTPARSASPQDLANRVPGLLHVPAGGWPDRGDIAAAACAAMAACKARQEAAAVVADAYD